MVRPIASHPAHTGVLPISFRAATALSQHRATGRTESGPGILLMTGGMFLFGAVDALAKLLTAGLDPIQIAWARQGGLLVVVLPMLLVRGRSILHTKRPGLQILRGTIAGVSPVLFISALNYVELADAIAVAFVAPFMVTVMGGLLLGEPVGAKRWIAVSIGFLGALIVIRPGLGIVHPAVGLVFIAAAMFAVRQIMSRTLSQSDPIETTICYTALAGVGVLTIPVIFVWTWPIPGDTLLLLACVALLAAGGEMMVIKALEIAEAVVVAPMQYTLLLWGSLYGYLLFGTVPDLWTWVGAGVIVVSGLYAMRLERRRMR